MFRVLSLLCLIGLIGCAPRATLTSFAGPTPGAERQVFIGTTRPLVSAIQAAEDRAASLSFASVTLSIPPERRLGEIPVNPREPDPMRDIVVTQSQRFAEAPEFRAGLSQALAAYPEGRREAVIYVHGFNNTYDEGVIRIAQLAHDLQIDGVAVHYAWPSQGWVLGYGHDRESALFARDGLQALIEEVHAAGADRIVLVAHSMGALISVEVMRQMDIARPGRSRHMLSGVLLISADIDPDVFVSQLARIDPVPEPFVLFVSQRDRALRLSARLNGSPRRIGNLGDIEPLADLPITVVDLSAEAGSTDHFAAGNSAVLLGLFSRIRDINDAFSGDRAGRAGLFPGTVLTIRNATEIVLSPGGALSN
ncbi:alpha/beta hydrolase [Aestuariibius insulae]|uniref:alpha/beta hydrolase n=1 Tax=Aestuariibius insulae TaxID=2058287 RepID=UPI00345E3C91